MDIDLTPYKNEFIELLRSCKRDGIDDVINDLEEWGFFEAPASAGHHLNVKGDSSCTHSILARRLSKCGKE